MTDTKELQCCEPQGQTIAASQVEAVRPVVLHPRVDVLETSDAWLLRAEMPGVDEGHAEVSLELQTLTIAGTAEMSEPEGYRRQFGAFRPRRYERSFRLPADIDRSGLEATLRHGVLSVRIPKAPEAQPTKVPVRGA
jgi:HSP20 family molecular chaperone IbpA